MKFLFIQKMKRISLKIFAFEDFLWKCIFYGVVDVSIYLKVAQKAASNLNLLYIRTLDFC
jgi:hypothetical protein